MRARGRSGALRVPGGGWRQVRWMGGAREHWRLLSCFREEVSSAATPQRSGAPEKLCCAVRCATKETQVVRMVALATSRRLTLERSAAALRAAARQGKGPRGRGVCPKARTAAALSEHARRAGYLQQAVRCSWR